MNSLRCIAASFPCALFIIFLLAPPRNSGAKVPVQTWGLQLGTATEDFAKGIAVSGDGRCYFAGETGGNLGGANAGRKDALLGAFDTNGQRLWLIQTGTPEDDTATSVAIAPDGNLYFAGSTDGKLGESHHGKRDIFVAKLDQTGRIIWIRQYGTEAAENQPAITCDQQGNVFVAGTTEGTLGQELAGDADAFLIKLDQDGNPAWTCQWGTGSADKARSVAVDATGALYVTGATSGSMPGYANAGKSDIFVSKIDPAGHLLWSKQFGTPASELGLKVLVDSATNIYIGGSSGGEFAGPQVGNNDAVLFKLSGTGELLWKRQFGYKGWDGIHGIVFSADGKENIIVGGCQNWKECQAFTREFDRDGHEQWSHVIPTAHATCGTQIGIDGDGGIYQVGGTHGPLFGDYEGSENDIFVVKLSSPK